jgi:hypothetical protein
MGGTTLLHSGHDHNAAAHDASGTTLRWSLVFSGVALGLLSMDLMVRRPMLREMAQVRSELSSLERDMEQLVGVRNQVWETNNLLTGLRSQHRQLDEARLSLGAVAQLRQEIENEAGKTSSTFTKLDRLISLQNSVIRNTENLESAEEHMSRLVALQNQALEAGEHTSEAMASVQELAGLKDAIREQAAGTDEAVEVVNRFSALKTQIASAGEGIDMAQSHVQEFAALKTDIFNEAGDLQAARETATQLISLKDDVIAKGGNTEQAFANSAQLFQLRDTLATQKDLEQASAALDQLVAMEETLTQQRERIIGAVENLEVLTDLTDELQSQVATVDSMRKSLLDIVLMESTVRRVAGLLEPLSELGNLRRSVGDAEVREIARTVRESRSASRFAQQPDTSKRTAELLKIDEITFFEEEAPQDILVPMPRKEEDLDTVIDSLK